MSDCYHPFCLLCLRAFVAAAVALAVPLPTFGRDADSAGACLAREEKAPIINKKDTLLYERKLFVTPDDVVRYVFLTNRWGDGDRSAAIYSAPRKKESLPGGYWLTVTVAADSLVNHPTATVRRFDAPFPASVAKVLHDLWLRVCQESRTDEKARPSAPTGIFSVVTTGGPRLTVVTTSLVDEHSICLSLLNLSESIIDYSKLSASQRAEAARKIEKEADALLKRVKARK